MPEKTIVSDPYWTQPEEKLFGQLQSSISGISGAEARKRLETYGPNLLGGRKKSTRLGLFINQFKSPIVILLLIATLISAFLQDWVDAAIILAIVVGSALLSFTQEYSASNAAEQLRAQVRIKANVLRDGEPVVVAAEEVVPGDVALLSAGSLIPADGVVLEANEFFVNQAVLTGETFPVEKAAGVSGAKSSLAERTNCVFMGTNVRSGSAKVLIIQTGLSTEFGQIAERLSLRPPETDFEHGIRRLGYLLTEVTLVMVFTVFAFNVFFHKPVLDSFLFSLALAVGLTPQLLPAIININLSRGSQAMAARGVIVRRLASIENFGSMDVLCTDKTGTLTEGVVQLDGAVDLQGQPSDLVFHDAYLNAHFQTGLANPLDEAIVTKAQPDIGEVVKVDEVPYDFVRKRLTVVVQEGDHRRLVTKGALDNVLAVCVKVQDGADARPFDQAYHDRIQQRFADWSSQGFRVLGVAAKNIPPQQAYTRDDEKDLTFSGFLLFFDPPKPGVQATISDLAEMGVQLKIITGDNHLVAQHTAQSIGMEVTGVVTGSQLEDLRDEALWHTRQPGEPVCGG